MTDAQNVLVDGLRSQFVAEQTAGFPLLRRVPDTKVIRFLDHFAELDRDGQSELIEILVEWSSYWPAPRKLIHVL